MLTVDSALSCLKNAFFIIYGQERSAIAQNFLLFEMLDHFSAKDLLDRKFKIKNYA